MDQTDTVFIDTVEVMKSKYLEMVAGDEDYAELMLLLQREEKARSGLIKKFPIIKEAVNRQAMCSS